MNNDLISREALKEKINELIPRWNKVTDYGMGRINSYEFVIKIIDNAPTVAVNCKDCDGYEAGFSAGLKDAEKPQGDIFPMEIVAGKCPIEVGGNCPLKPQGEWKLHGMIYYCSVCGHDYEQGGNNFCGNCGADMRKGGAE